MVRHMLDIDIDIITTSHCGIPLIVYTFLGAHSSFIFACEMDSEETGVVFRRNCEDEENIWDDSALIRAYDKAISAMKSGKNSQESQKTTQKLNTISESGGKGKCKNSKKGNKVHTKNTSKWQLGDCCRAVFSEDGLEYEANIVKIDYESDVCTVRFIGYLNEEQVNIGDLSSSHGQASQHLQQRNAATEQMNYNKNDFDSSDMEWNDISGNYSGKKIFKDHKKHRNHTTKHKHLMRDVNMPAHVPPRQSPKPSMIPSIPPPPPLPVFCDSGDDDDESLASMLISWYMSGYHTGYYQGQKQANQRSRQDISSCSHHNCNHSCR